MNSRQCSDNAFAVQHEWRGIPATEFESIKLIFKKPITDEHIQAGTAWAMKTAGWANAVDAAGVRPANLRPMRSKPAALDYSIVTGLFL